MNRKSITQSYVLTPDGSEYILRYYLVVGQNAADTAEYGVMIEVCRMEQCASETRFFTADEGAALKVIDLLASGFVFPDTLDDVLENLEPVFGY